MRSHLALAAAVVALCGCSTYGVGVTVPIGRMGGVGVSVGSDGSIGGSVGVGVGRGGVGVSVGGSGRLPASAEPAPGAASSPR